MAELIDVKTKPEKSHGPSVAMETRPAHPFMATMCGNGFHDIMDLPQPLPCDSPSPQQALPGAWAHGGTSLNSNESQDYSEQGFKTSLHPVDTEEPNMDVLGQDTRSGQETQGLAVASLVEAKNLPIALPEAHAEDTRMRQKKSRQFHACIVLSILLFLSAMFVILFPPTGRKKPNNESNPAATSLTYMPTQAPTSTMDYVVSLLPEDTVRAMEDPDSPQAQAYQWLLADDVNVPIISVFTEERIKQRLALATLYYSTKGDGWVVNSNWLNHSVHECGWYIKPDFAERGTLSLVTPSFLAGFFPASEPKPSPCGENGLFQHLWLDQNNLDGTVPEELYLLTSLKSLSLGGNPLEGTISTLVGQITALEGLAIKGQKNAGSIPTEIGILSNLRALILIENDHHGRFPVELWQLTKLETFYLGKNPNLNGTIPSEIVNMSNLNWILVHDTGFTGTIPSEIALLKQLSWLALAANQLSGMLPTELGLLSQLTVLSVYSNSFEGALPTHLGQLSSLLLLSLRDNKFVGSIPSELGLLTSLTVSLNLKNNQLTSTIPTELGMLTNSAILDLMGNQLSGQIPSELGQLTRMGKLTVANNSLSGAVPKELASLWHSLYILRFEGNALLSGIIPEDLCSLNGTCVSSPVSPCESNYGLSFDCTILVCGCDCSCSNGI